MAECSIYLDPHTILSTGWSKSLCAPDDYKTIVRCAETFWSPCT